MMVKISTNKKLQSVNSQDNIKYSKNSDLKQSSSMSASSKFKLKKELSKGSKIEKPIPKREDKKE